MNRYILTAIFTASLFMAGVSMAVAEEATPAETKEAGAAVELEEITVTGTREGELKSETPLAIGTVKGEAVRDTHPSHPTEIIGRVPGAYVSVTGGEGHTTSIRHPITTSPVYLYLEDGIPVRSTGFFNHNALYEVNIPQSGGIEISKGPGTALYGSDAIGGVINVLTRPAPLEPELELNVETGSFGWTRALVSAGGTKDNNGVRVDANVTHSDGWRTKTSYDRQSSTVRWDRMMESGATLKTVVTYSNIDQATAGTSAISATDYQNNPTYNYTPISYRRVNSVRLSSAYEIETGSTLLSVTPYVRSNKMDLLPNWTLSGTSGQTSTSQNNSLGIMAKYRMDFEPMRTRVIVGADADYSPGGYVENAITATKTGNVYTSYTVGAKSYDYKAEFRGISPYLHTEFSPSDALRLNVGLRYDNLGYSYTNSLGELTTGTKKRPADTSVSFTHLSPKLGLTYAFTDEFNGYLSYRHTFRVPSEGQLFRQGNAANTVELKPVKVDSYDVGVRGGAADKLSYEVNAYYMTKDDDILNYTDTTVTPNTTAAQNAGRTLHQGVEIGAGTPLAGSLRLDVSYSYAKHSYQSWSPKTGLDYSGKEQAAAPNEIGNVRLSSKPEILSGGKCELEWTRLGKYWMDDANTMRYPGHDLFNFRISYKHKSGLELFGRISNLMDARWATSTSYSATLGDTYAPGNPRSFFAGVSYTFK